MSIILRAGFVVATITALAGCVAYRPQSLDPQSVMTQLREATPEAVVVEHASPGASATVAELRSTFDPSNGLNENEVVAVALALNPELRAKRLEVGEAQAQLIAAGLWPNPEVGVGWKAGIGGTSGYKFDGDLLFELLRPGERSARSGGARARVEQVRHDIVAEEYRLVAETRTQRLAVLAAEQAVELLRQETSIRDRASDLVRQRRKLGEGTELDISATELELAEVRRDLRKAETELESERRELNRLMGLPPEYALLLEDSGRPLRITVFSDLTGEQLEQRVLSGRPELQAKEAEYARAERELQLATLGQYPRLKAGPSFERELGGEKSLGLGLSLEVPVFNRNQAEIAEKTSQRDRVRAEYAATLHRLRANAAGAMGTLRRARIEVETQEREVLPLIRRNQDLFEGAFKAREINILDWITAQQRAVRARREYLESVVRYAKALVELEAATGTPLGRPASQPTTRATTAPTTRP